MAAEECSLTGNNWHLESFLSPNELSHLPKNEATKINHHMQQRYEEYLALKSLFETETCRLNSKILENVKQNSELAVNYENTVTKLTLAEEKINELQIKVNSIKLELENSNDKCLKYTDEIKILNKTSEIVLDEKNELIRALERQSAEFIRLKGLVENSSLELHVAKKANCEVLSVNDQYHDKEVILRQNEKKIEQERGVYNAKISALTEELNRLTGDLQRSNHNSSKKVLQLEAYVKELTEKLDVAYANVNQLIEEKDKVNSQNEELQQKLIEQSTLANKLSTNFTKELGLKSKTFDLYKTLQDSAEMKAFELVDGVATLQKLLDQATEKYGELETKLKESEIQFEDVLREKNETISSLRTELENANQLLSADAINENVDPESVTYEIIKEICNSGFSLTQLYTQLKEVKIELKNEKAESKRLSVALNDVVAEIKHRMPNIEKTKQKLIETLDSNRILTQQLDSLKIQCTQLKNDLSKAIQNESTSAKENGNLKIELEDLGNQICFLLKNKQTRPFYSNISSQAQLNSSQEAFTFSSIQELQRNNQKLIRNIREISEKYDKLESLKNLFDSADYQNKVKLLENKVTVLTQAQERQTKSVTELIRQRDLYKKLCHDKNLNTSLIDGSGNNNLTNDQTVIEEKLRTSEKQFENIKEEYRAYKETKEAHEKKLKDEIIGLQQDLKNIKASNEITTAHNQDQVKHLQSVITNCNKKISTLEDCKIKLHSAISNHELSIKNLQLELQKAQQKVEKAKNVAERYKLECDKILQSYNMRFTENNIFLEGQKNNEMLCQKIDFMKEQLHSHEDCYKKLQSRYLDVRRECETLRRNLEKEQEDFSTTRRNLLNAADKAVKSLKEEKKLTDALKIELSGLKNGNIQDTSIYTDNNRKDDQIKTLQAIIESKELQLKSYSELSERAEISLTIMRDEYRNYKSHVEITLKEQTEIIEGLRDRCSELEGELLICSEDQPSLQDQLTDAQNQLKVALESLENYKINLNDTLSEKSLLSEALQNIEQQYNELLGRHTNDIKKFNQSDVEISKLQNKLEDIISMKDSILIEMKNKEKSWLIKENDLLTETKQLQHQINEININKNLILDQLQSINNQISLQNTMQSIHSIDDQFNTSTFSENVQLCPRAINEILTFIRDDNKNISAKCVTLQSELSNVKIQLKSTEEQLHKTKLELERIMNNPKSSTFDKRTFSNTSLDVVSESNRYLQTERDNLKARIAVLSDSIKSLEIQLSQLQDINSDLKSKNDDLDTTNESLRDEVARLKKNIRTNVDRASKTNSEDYKRLLTEKDHYMKSLSAEKESVKKLVEELSSVKREKIKTDEENSMLSRQHAMVVEDHKRLNAELLRFQDSLAKITQEYETCKSALALKTKENSKLLKDISNKEESLTEIKNKEQQVRKVAKRYRNLNDDNLKIIEENNNKLKAYEAQIAELQSQVDSLKVDLETSFDKEEKAKQLLKTAKSKYTNLYEAKQTMRKELDECQTKLKAFEHGDADEQITIIRSHYEEKLSKLEKEKEDCSTESAKEVEELAQKIDFLQQQLTSQSNTKQLSNTEKPMSPPTANIKPMAPCSAAGTSSIRRSGEPPQASVRPVAQVQPVHDAHSTEYMPASSSRPIMRAAPPESTQDSDESQPPQQAVAMVMPRVEPQVALPPGQSGVSTSNTPEQRAHKRPSQPLTTFPQIKKTRVDEEYQVPTSSQRDQDDEGVIVVESDEECTGTQYMEEGDEDDEEEVFYSEEQAGEDGDDDHDPEAMEEEEVESSEDDAEVRTESTEPTAPQIEAISSGTEPSGALSLAGGDDGDDGIVPSTPTLYVPRRNDGFGEAVVSPLSGANAVPTGARFTFAEAGEASHHDTHADLTVALPPTIPEDWVPSVTSNQTESIQMGNEDREAEASSDEARRTWPQDEGENTNQADESNY